MFEHKKRASKTKYQTSKCYTLTFLPPFTVPPATGLAFTSLVFFFPKSKNIAVEVAEFRRRIPDDDDAEVSANVRRIWAVGRGALKPKPESKQRVRRGRVVWPRYARL